MRPVTASSASAHAASASATSAAEAGLLSCPACTLVSRVPRELARDPPATLRCPRCEARLHVRKPDSVRRTWALLVAAYILYVPANLLPIMNTSSLFAAQTDTIMSGVIYLWNSGSWATALVVFVASIVVPAAKLAVLTLLVISVQRRWTFRPRLRSRLYHVVSFVGRWSMLDIFVVAVLVALVQLRSVAEIQAGPAAFAFGAVVVLTIFAATSFDPRLIWDRLRPENERDAD